MSTRAYVMIDVIDEVLNAALWWCFQAAILTYMDEGGTLAVSQSLSVPMAEFVCDVTIGEGEEVSKCAITWEVPEFLFPRCFFIF